ncbi:MAG: hypothetical protein KGY99_11065 [Phycisphaerae bacterium]|nr:hypothetical protein [Phycisphaerae bacterium]
MREPATQDRPDGAESDDTPAAPEDAEGAAAPAEADAPTGAAEGDAEAKEAPTCFVIKVHGVIGRRFRASQMRQYLEQAATASADIVLLDVDTPGGRVQDAEEIVDLLIEHSELPFAAYVHKALSAGAAITLCCEDIYMDPAATIGAATSYMTNRRGGIAFLPSDVEEKFRSAWRATCRKAAENGGHSPLLAEAMADSHFKLTMREGEDGPILERDGDGRVLADDGRLLTLTAGEAVACGLAEAKVAERDKLAEAMGVDSLRMLHGEELLEDQPGTICDVVRTKLDTRPTEAESTQLQREAWIRETEEWLAEQCKKRRGEDVYLVLRMVEAERPATTEDVVEARNRVEHCTKGLRHAPSYLEQEWAKALKEAQENLKDLYSIDVLAHPMDDPRLLIVCQFANKHADAIGELRKDSTLYMKGRLAEMDLAASEYGRHTVMRWHTDREIDAGIRLVGCETGKDVKAVMERRKDKRDERAKGKPSPSRPASKPAPPPKLTPEQHAAKELRMAKLYRANGMHGKAVQRLRKLIANYPKTKAAAEARAMLKEMQGGGS